MLKLQGTASAVPVNASNHWALAAKGGHLKVFLGKQASILPMHGSSKEIGKGLEHRIKRDLGLE
jgi:hypothetical protein